MEGGFNYKGWLGSGVGKLGNLWKDVGKQRRDDGEGYAGYFDNWFCGFWTFDLPLTFLLSSRHHHLDKMSFSFYFVFLMTFCLFHFA